MAAGVSGSLWIQRCAHEVNTRWPTRSLLEPTHTHTRELRAASAKICYSVQSGRRGSGRTKPIFFL
ncbi:hypothetical protein BS78_08G028800 [Paspalum vaginatum]|nr:hypothetical protein BS78_08G028800 [Paspalum vaginatum]